MKNIFKVFITLTILVFSQILLADRQPVKSEDPNLAYRNKESEGGVSSTGFSCDVCEKMAYDENSNLFDTNNIFQPSSTSGSSPSTEPGSSHK